MLPEKRKREEICAVSVQERKDLVKLVHEANLCPISHTLPVVPVIAEDGHIYEQEAIKKWFLEKSTSPLTNKPMGRRLIPSHAARQTIEALTESGKLDEWGSWETAAFHIEKAKAHLTGAVPGGDAAAAALLDRVFDNVEGAAFLRLPDETRNAVAVLRDLLALRRQAADLAGRGGAAGIGAEFFAVGEGARGRSDRSPPSPSYSPTSPSYHPMPPHTAGRRTARRGVTPPPSYAYRPNGQYDSSLHRDGPRHYHDGPIATSRTIQVAGRV